MNTLEYKKNLITASNKKAVIKKLFNDVSKNYNIMNDLMSLGLHRVWKKDMVLAVSKEKANIILDLAGGTGDISLMLSRLVEDVKIIIYDLSINMMLQSKRKFLKKNKDFSFVNGSAEELALSDNSIDLITLGFGLRNFSNIEKSVRECYRVLKYGKKLYCLEFSPSTNIELKYFYDFYSSRILPKIGKYIAKNEDAYRYLVDSIKNFPHNSELKNIFKESGFFCYNQTKYLGGVAYLNVFCKV